MVSTILHWRKRPLFESTPTPTQKPKIQTMNKLQMKGTWEQVKGRLKQTYGTLTDDDLAYAEGKEEELVGRLKSKLGKTEEEVREILEK